MISEPSTLNEILGTSSVPENQVPVTEGQGEGKAADAVVNDKPTSSEEKNAGQKVDGDDAGKEAGDGGEKAQPYHKDPAWQRIIQERDEARNGQDSLKSEMAELRGTVAALMELAKAGKGEAEGADSGDPEYTDITSMSDEEIAEKLATDPKGLMANIYAQIRSEFHAELSQKDAQKATNETQNANRATYDQYVKDNPDFESMWKKGEIQEFIKTHPGHNPLSAHMKLTEETRVTKAVEAQAKTIEKNIRAKLKAGTLHGADATPRATLSDAAPELQNPNAYGGKIAVQAERLRASRAASGT